MAKIESHFHFGGSVFTPYGQLDLSRCKQTSTEEKKVPQKGIAQQDNHPH